MTTEPQISALFAAIGMWARRKGADNLAATPGLWTHREGEYLVAMTSTAARPEFLRLDVEQEHVLHNPRPGWRGVPWASIKLGLTEDGWVYATGAADNMGGFGEPLGIWSDLPNLRTYPTAEAALVAARARLARWVAGHPPSACTRAITAWLVTLEHQQGDLFQ